jgi:hypothetical protein
MSVDIAVERIQNRASLAEMKKNKCNAEGDEKEGKRFEGQVEGIEMCLNTLREEGVLV